MHPIDTGQETYSTSTFEPLQIVCLEHSLQRLYAEVVQTVETRKTCWVRPLVLAEHETYLSLHSEQSLDCPQIYDLRQGADLLLPTILFRAAIDVEVIPLLCQLGPLSELGHATQETRSRLNQFVRKICLSHPEIFSNKASAVKSPQPSNNTP